MTCFRKTLISCVFSGGLVAAPTAAWGQDASWRPSFLTQTEVEFEADLDLIGGASGEQDEADTTDVRSLFPDPYGRYDFATLQSATGLDTDALATRLWNGVWGGSITSALDPFFPIMMKQILLKPMQGYGH